MRHAVRGTRTPHTALKESVYGECEAIFSLFAADLEVKACLRIVGLCRTVHVWN